MKVLADDEFYSNEAEIEISILRVELELITPELEIRNETEITLNEKLFKIQARAIGGELLTPQGIEFGFTALPTLSTLKIREKELKPNHMISYDEIKAGHIKIAIKEEIRKQLVDILPVKLKMDGLERMANFRINYLPDPEKVFLVNKGLKVDEGAKALLTSDSIFASNLRGDRIEIELLESPKHGSLRLINYNENESAGNTTRIRMEDIEEQS